MSLFSPRLKEASIYTILWFPFVMRIKRVIFPSITHLLHTPLSSSGVVFSSWVPFARVLGPLVVPEVRFIMKSVFFQPSFSRGRRSSLWAQTSCSTWPAPRTSRSECLLWDAHRFTRLHSGSQMAEPKQHKNTLTHPC